MFKQIALISWAPDAPQASRTALMESASALVKADLSYQAAGLTPPSWRGGDLVWHLHFADQHAWATSGAVAALDLIEQQQDIVALDMAAYPVVRHLARAPSLTDGIYRTLLVSVDPHASRIQRQEFVVDVEQMPDHISEIRNWALNETIAWRGAKPWTHVWEQEYATIGDLTGAYLQAPYHIFHVDRWFDHEMDCCIVGSTNIRHSASELDRSVIANY